MALFGTLGPIVNAVSGIAGNLFGSGTLGTVGKIGATILGGLTAPQPIASGPIIQQIPAPASVAPMVAMSAAPKSMPLVAGAAAQAMRSIGRGISGVVANALIKIAEATGRRSMSLRQAVRIVKRMGKFAGPAAVATALGLTAEELGELILADANRPRRRMNPANVSALRRSMRRIQSFHRLCSKADMLRSRGRSRRAPARRSPTVVQCN